MSRRKETVQQFAERQLLRTHKPYAKIAQEAREKFHSGTTPASIRHYASKLRHSHRVPDRPHASELAYA